MPPPAHPEPPPTAAAPDASRATKLPVAFIDVPVLVGVSAMRRYGCHKSMADGDHFISGSDAAGQQGKVQSACAGIDSDGIAGLTILGKLRFKGLDFRSKNKLTII